MRAFVAIDVNETVRAALADAQEGLRAVGAPVRWVHPDRLHLTLKFLGEVEGSALEAVAARVEQAAEGIGAFGLAIAAVAPFPSARRPRVVGARLEETPPELARLAERLDGAFVDLGVAEERRPFRPHITLGRLKSLKSLGELFQALGAVSAGLAVRWSADHLCLYESVLRPDGPIYTVRHQVPLAGPQGEG